MINYQFFPRSHGVTKEMQAVIDCFKKIEAILDDGQHRVSNEVLSLLRPYWEGAGCRSSRVTPSAHVRGRFAAV